MNATLLEAADLMQEAMSLFWYMAVLDLVLYHVYRRKVTSS